MYVFLRYLILLQCCYLIAVSGVANAPVKGKMPDQTEFTDKVVGGRKELEVLGTLEKDEEAVKKVNKATVDLFKVFGEDKEFDKQEFASSVATGVSKGLVNLVKGIKTKQPYYIFSGIMSVLTSVTGLLGPFKNIADAALTLLSTVIDMYGKPAEESQEDIFKRLLEDMSLKELKGEVEGMQLFYTTLSSQIKILDNAGGTTAGGTTAGGTTAGGTTAGGTTAGGTTAAGTTAAGTTAGGKPATEDEEKSTDVELEQLHTLSYENFVMFGRIEARIKEDCKKPIEDKSEEARTKRCMTSLEIYVQLTLGRQVLLAQLAAVSDKKGLTLINKMATNLIQQAQTQDQKVLDFLTKPLENVDYRAAIYSLYKNKGDHTLVVDYIRRLDQMSDLEKKGTDTHFDNRHAMFCSEIKLGGRCRLVARVQITEKYVAPVHPTNWGAITQSIFVPPGLKVEGKMTGGIFDSFKGNLGPLYGIGVYSHKDLMKVEHYKVTKEERRSDIGIVICKGKGDDEWCQHLDPKASAVNLNTLNGRDFTEPSSITIPDGYEVSLLATDDKTVIGPIYGQQELKAFCKKTWASIIAKKIEDKKIEDKSSADFVVVCEENNFGGYCQQLGTDFEKTKKEFNTNDDPAKRFDSTKSKSDDAKYNGKNVCGVKDVQSMKIPAGFAVYLYDDKDVLSGPWTGPLELSKLKVEKLKVFRTVKNLLTKVKVLNLKIAAIKDDPLPGTGEIIQ